MSMFPAMLSELNLPYPLSILQAANISTTLLIIVRTNYRCLCDD